MAKARYLDDGICHDIVSALRKLFTDDIPKYSPRQKWQRWREEELWTNDCNDVFEANLEGLNRLYKFKIQNKTKMNLAEATELFAISQLKIADKLIKFAYGMSKMTIINEEF